MIRQPFYLAALLLSFALPALAFAQGRSLNDELDPVRLRHGLPALAAAVVKSGAIRPAGQG